MNNGLILMLSMIIGFGIVVTLAYLGKCIYLYLFVMSDAESLNAPKKAKIEYKTGMAALLAGALITFLIICYAVGRALIGML